MGLLQSFILLGLWSGKNRKPNGNLCVAFRQLGMSNANGAKSMEKLSSGHRINRAGDDAAGLSISEKMRGQIRGLNQASKKTLGV